MASAEDCQSQSFQSAHVGDATQCINEASAAKSRKVSDGSIMIGGSSAYVAAC